MSWLYSQALVEEYSAASCSDGEPSAQLNVMPTQHKFWRNDKTMEFSNLSRFGLTLRLLTEQDGEALLMSFLAGFHARTLAAQEKAQELTENEADCGATWRGSLAKYNPDTHSLKTAQCSLIEDLTGCCVTLPRWGSMRNGELYKRRMLVRHMKGSESGLWPTPTVCGNYNRPGVSKTSGMGLASAVMLYLTPRATDVGRGEKSETFVKRMGDRGSHCFQSLPSQIGGPLNPNWVEWLMGWPIGWTDLKPLETGKFLEWQQQHSLNFQGDKEAA